MTEKSHNVLLIVALVCLTAFGSVSLLQVSNSPNILGTNPPIGAPPQQPIPPPADQNSAGGVIGGIIGGSPTLAPPPQPTLPNSAFDVIEKILNELPVGNIAFDAPPTMQLDKAQTVRLLLSQAKSAAQLQAQIQAAAQGQAVVETHSVHISPLMEARLTGENFDIRAAQPDQRLIDPSQVNQWQWDVKPTLGGTQKLHLTLSAMISVDGHTDAPFPLRTFDQAIVVKVPLTHRLGSFLRDNWTWIAGLGAGIVALLGFIRKFLRWRRRRRLHHPHP